MRDATADELALIADFKKNIVAAKADIDKLKVLARAANDAPVMIALGHVYADLDKAHQQAAREAMGVFSNATPIIMGPGR